MDELRFVRREDQTLVVTNDADQEFRLLVDDALLSELRALSRRDRPVGKVRPREIQALIRSGKSRAQIVAETGLEEADVERYEEPVLAERRYILERAKAVPVRTEAHTDEQERFGAVIQERLVALNAEASEWASWREEETGWMVSVEFISRDVAHRAVWSFEHRKGALSPVTPDAVSLSKQGDVGDRLIPKLRAVDAGDTASRFDSGAFEPGTGASQRESAPAAASDAPPAASLTPAVPAVPSVAPAESSSQRDAASDPAAQLESADARYERRREIDQRAIKTNETSPVDLSQTADLLDALRRRRGERDQEHRAAALKDATSPENPETSAAAETSASVPGSPAADSEDAAAPAPVTPTEPTPGARARSIWGASGVSSSAPPVSSRPRDTAPIARVPQPPQSPTRDTGATPSDTAPLPGARIPQAPRVRTVPPAPVADAPAESTQSSAAERSGTPATQGPEEPASKAPKKGRASIPSWDDILFGTRSDDDPS